MSDEVICKNKSRHSLNLHQRGGVATYNPSKGDVERTG